MKIESASAMSSLLRSTIASKHHVESSNLAGMAGNQAGESTDPALRDGPISLCDWLPGFRGHGRDRRDRARKASSRVLEIARHAASQQSDDVVDRDRTTCGTECPCSAPWR